MTTPRPPAPSTPSPSLAPGGPPGSARARAYTVIFESDTPAGRAFDLALIIAIVLSVFTVALDSVEELQDRWGTALFVVEWLFTIAFTVEYALRLWCVRSPRAYALSFFGVVDLLSIVPTYLSLILPAGRFLAAVRILRVIRVFRILKLVRYMGEASILLGALRASRYKITVFLLTVATIVVVVGSIMYLVEGPGNGFTSIPRGIYWAIVTLTTVGYGDIAPRTVIGQALASVVMILGYGIIAVPTGIVSVELVASSRAASLEAVPCGACGFGETDPEASFCRRCGARRR